MNTSRWLVVAPLIALITALFTGPAWAVDRNVAGSLQLDYHLSPERSTPVGSGPTFRGFTTEAALKLTAEISEQASVNLKICIGCHGFETDMVHLDYRFADELNVRVGRFSPSFGAFNLRHDPANHRLSDKPLVYDMGRMLRVRDWNLGVLPSPFPDNGVEASGTHWFGSKTQLDYAAHLVSGFKGSTAGADLDFVQSRSGSLYYVDNNDQPAYGGRLALTERFSQNGDVTLGTSLMRGAFDPGAKLMYTITGADLTLRIDRTNLRIEYLMRRQDLDVSDPTRYRYEVPAKGGDSFVKHGGYAELELPVTASLDLVGRFDALFRSGNVLVDSPLQARSGIFRYTLGTAYSLRRGLRLKYSTELWSFSDTGYSGRNEAVSMHIGVATAF